MKREYLEDNTAKEKGVSIIFVGAPQTGKTTALKRLLKENDVDPRNIFALDINGEYNGVAYQTIEHTELIDLALKTREQTIIFEEATTYFGSTNPRIVRALLSRTKGHLAHNVFFSFHYLASIPADILPFIDYIYITKTYEKARNIPHPLSALEPKDAYKYVKVSDLYKREA